MSRAWNCHPIPGRGIPNQLQVGACNTSLIHPSEIPDRTSAVDRYRLQAGVDLEIEKKGGVTVLKTFSATISDNSTPLGNAIQIYITPTNES